VRPITASIQRATVPPWEFSNGFLRGFAAKRGLRRRADAIINHMSMIRLVTIDDAPVLANLLTANRKFLAPWQPTRAEAFFTTTGQREAIDTGEDL
jgi:hypothetical protein